LKSSFFLKRRNRFETKQGNIRPPFLINPKANRMKNRVVTRIVSLFLLSIFITNCLPPGDPYPHEPPATVRQRAKVVSDNLESYIRKWVSGTAAAQIPAEVIPTGITDSKNFYLKRPEDATPEETWAVRVAREVNLDSIYNGLPDPNVTYLFLGTALAPFGSKLVLEGEFPHARFFTIQVTPPLNGVEYYAQRVFGTAEVSFVDADIDPLPGNVNPYRVGANRNATSRKYRVEVDLAIGDPTSLNGNAHRHPYRQRGNKRTGGMIVYQGPLGKKDVLGLPIQGGGDWNLGAVWIRIYNPDKSKGAFGGVPLPKAWFELPSGEKYFVGSDFTTLVKRANATVKARSTDKKPNPNFGPNVGWFKSWGIVRSILNGVNLANGWSRRDSAQRVRDIDLGWTGRGEFQPAPGNIEPHATTNNYATYLGRSMAVPKGMVAVLTGKLPTFPATRNGAATMPGAQLRYWSIGGYDNDAFSPFPGACLNILMDEDVVIDNNRNYIIAYSKPEDRPANATTTNGVSWVNWGPIAELGLMIRYVTVGPEWTFDKAPDEKNLTWAKTDWAGSAYDSTLVGLNTHQGFMQCYLPRVSYMSRAEFEALGQKLNVSDIPVWTDETNEIGISEAFGKTVTASSVYNNESQYAAKFAVDGNLKTRWSSNWTGGPEFLTVDLGGVKKISGVKLFWEFAAARDYEIQISNNNSTWETISARSNGDGGVDVITNLRRQARYVRVYMTRGVLGNFSLYEMEVFSPEASCAGVSTTSVQEPIRTPEVRIYPNPVRTQLFVDLDGFLQQTKLPVKARIVDASGKVQQQIMLNQSPAAVDVNRLAKGSYVLQIETKSGVQTAKFVKSN